MRSLVLIAFIALAFTFGSCSAGTSTSTDDTYSYTLYRNSVAGTPEENAAARYHVATFDSSDGERYNRENCEVARDLFQNQPGVRTRFWCEKGRYRK